MSKKKKTPWFDGSTKPVRVGVYETPEEDGEGPYYSYFDGIDFCGQWESVTQAKEKAATESRRAHWRKHGSQVDKWRGLTSPSRDAS